MAHILLNPRKVRNYHLLHYWNICKYFSSKCVAPRPKAKSAPEHNLLYYAAVNQLPAVQETLLNVDFSKVWEPEVISLVDKHLLNLSLDLLKAATQRSSDKWLLKLCLARYYAKYEALYVLADEIITQGLKHFHSVGISLSLYLIRLELFKKMNAKRSESLEAGNEETSEINPSNIQRYLELNEVFESLKVDIADQLVPQRNFWSEFQVPEPDCSSLISLAAKVANKAKQIKKGWSHYKQFLDVNFPQPLLIYGLYLTFAENDLIAGEELLRKYNDLESKRRQEVQKQMNKISLKTLFETLQFTVSGVPSSLGKIVSCTNNIERMLGFQKQTIHGKSINTLIPSLLADRENKLANNSNITIDPDMLNKTREMFVMNQEGYLTLCWIYVTLKFSNESGLCYYILVNRIEDDQRVVLVKGTGKIINFSKSFAKDFKLNLNEKPNINIFNICPEFEEIADAFVWTNTKNPQRLSPEVKTFQKANTYLTPASQVSLPAAESSMKYLDHQRSRKEGTERASMKELCEKYAKGDPLPFYLLPSRGQRASGTARKERLCIVYNVRVEASNYHGDVVLKLVLSKVKRAKGNLESGHWNTYYTNHTYQDNYSNFRSEENRLQASEPDSSYYPQILSPLGPGPTRLRENTLSPIKNYLKKTTFRKTEILTEQQPDEEDTIPPETLEPAAISNLRSDSHKGRLNVFLSGCPDSAGLRPMNTLTTEGDNLTSPLRYQTRGYTIMSKEDYPSRNRIPESMATLNIARTNTQSLLLKQSGGDHDNIDTNSSAEDPLNILSPTSSENYVKIRTIKTQEKIPEEAISKGRFGETQVSRDSHKLNKIKAIKKIQEALEKRKPNRQIIYFNIAFFLTMIFQITFLVWLNFNVLTASQKASASSQVLQALYFRSYWINLSNQETRFWNAVRGRWLSWPLADEIATTNITFSSTNKYNQDLRRAVQDLTAELQPLFYEKNVDIYGRDNNNQTILLSTDDTFEATNKIIYRGFRNVYKPGVLPPVALNFVDYDSRFIFDNSYGDLLVVSESLISTIKTYMFDNLEKARTDMLIFLIAALVLLLTFVIWSIKFVNDINQDFWRFLRIFFLLPNIEAKKTESMLSTLNDVLKDDSNDKGRSFLSNPVRLFFDVKNSLSAASAPHSKNLRKTASTSSLNRASWTNWKILLQLICALCLMVVIMAVYYDKALNQVDTIQKQQTNINSALQNMNTQSLISSQIQSLTMDNGTTTIRHRPILDNLRSDLDSLHSVSEIQDNLKSDGDLSPRQQEIFFNLSCANAYSTKYVVPNTTSKNQCNRTSKYSGYLGLVNILPDMTSGLNQYMLNFIGLNKTTANLRTMYNPSNYQTLIDLSMVYFLLSFDATIEEFSALMKDLEDQRTILAWVAVCVCFVLVALIWGVIIKRLIRRKFMSQELLSLIPIKLIMKNIPLKRYVEGL